MRLSVGFIDGLDLTLQLEMEMTLHPAAWISFRLRCFNKYSYLPLTLHISSRLD